MSHKIAHIPLDFPRTASMCGAEPCDHAVSGNYAGWTTRSAHSRGRRAHRVSALEQASDLSLILSGRARGQRLHLELRYSLGPLDLWPSSPDKYRNGPLP